MNTPCMYCYGTADRCAAEDPHGFVCNRLNGHDGDHAACDGDDHPISTWPQRGDTTGEVLARLQATMARLLDEADTELRAQARCPEPDEHVRYDAALAAAEKAERERDEARRERGEALDRLCEASRPLTPDAITDEMVKRAWAWASRHELYGSGSVRILLEEALTEPPARPEGVEAVAVRLAQAGAAVGVHMTAKQRDALADHLAAMHVRVVGEDDGGDETPDVCPHVGGPGGDCGCPL